MSNNFLPALASGDLTFSSYISEVNKIPSLSEEEEFSFAKKYINYDDLESAHKLVTSHLKLVTKIVMSYRWYGIALMDLVSEGNIGLMKAVKKFDPEKGVRLSTYSMWWIKATIQEYILKSWSLVKIGTTAAQKKLFFNLGKMKKKIRSVEGREFSDQDYKQVAHELDVSINDVAEMNVRMNRDGFLDDPISDGSGTTFLDSVENQNELNQEELIINKSTLLDKRKLLAKALLTLNDREKLIIQKRKLKDTPDTLDTLSKDLGVSKERVRQIEERVMQKLTMFVQSNS
jgi:RNA polymerase sigma-32 factor